MIVIPALDLRDGKCVRMEQGDTSKQTIYDDDPVERARTFVAAGAQRLHVIDLDAALGSGNNHEAIASICQAVSVPVQVGGGIRSLTQAQARIAAGAANVILGTLLVEDERTARYIALNLGDRVIAGIDARGSEVAIHGWQERTPMNRDALIKRVAGWGITRLIFTEIGRDGMGKGFDVDALREVAQAAPVRITASGGAATLDDVRALKMQAPANVDSCIVGSALYKGTLDLKATIEAVA
jgi:phosphoribosylformimino-5-aminoimidazole carboxamide ribotide isomerase